MYGVGGAGALVVGLALVELISGPVPSQWVFFAALTCLGGLYAIKIPSLYASFSVFETFVFALVLLFGPAPAIATAAAESVIEAALVRGRPRYRTLFDIAQPAVSVWFAATVFYGLSGVDPLLNQVAPLRTLFVPLLAFATSYFALNGLLTAVAIRLETGSLNFEYVREHRQHVLLNYFVSLSLLVLFVENAENLQSLSLSACGVALALLTLSYFSKKGYVEQVVSGHRHLGDLNKLYLSTVETLATAIDAKDQVTSGHLRRVQRSALRLAHDLGMTDRGEIKALECASLLHDLGKLVVPEHILNKPGPLTRGEFDQMKRHASMGADILSKVHFPYPVEPVVRHHHENWDGSGYPDGLSGEAIPLGARIVAVVDCFDALRSDRPYRRRLPVEEALHIIQSRRASMYDPRVVDRFLEIYEELAVGDDREQSDNGHETSLHQIESMTAPATVSEERTTFPSDGVPSSARPQLGSPEEPRSMLLANLRDAVVRRRDALPKDAVLVAYRCDVSTETLRVYCVSSEEHAWIRERCIPLGERVAGWVGTTRQTVINADPLPDFHEVSAHRLAFRSCVSVPVEDEGSLVGVLSIYSSQPAAFNKRSVAIAEALAGDLASELSPSAQSSCSARLGRPRLRDRAWQLEREVQERTKALAHQNEELIRLNQQLESTSHTDPLTGLWNRRFLTTQIEKEVDLVRRAYADGPGKEPSDSQRPLMFLMLDLDGLKAINDVYGHTAGDRVLTQIRDIVTPLCRKSDMLIRWGGDEFLLVGRNTDAETAERLAERLRRGVVEHTFGLGGGQTARLSCSLGFALYPFLPSAPTLLDWEQVVHMADRGQYRSKEAGRNGWTGVLASPTVEPETLIRRMNEGLNQLAEERVIILRTDRPEPESDEQCPGLGSTVPTVVPAA